MFSTMDPEVFDIFINECLVPTACETSNDSNNQQVTLLCGKKAEAEVYHRVPYDIPLLSEDILNQYGIKCIGKYYYTRHHNSILDAADYNWVERQYKLFDCKEFQHSHFWPLENPDNFSDQMANDVVRYLVNN